MKYTKLNIFCMASLLVSLILILLQTHRADSMEYVRQLKKWWTPAPKKTMSVEAYLKRKRMPNEPELIKSQIANGLLIANSHIQQLQDKERLIKKRLESLRPDDSSYAAALEEISKELSDFVASQSCLATPTPRSDLQNQQMATSVVLASAVLALEAKRLEAKRLNDVITSIEKKFNFADKNDLDYLVDLQNLSAQLYDLISNTNRKNFSEEFKRMILLQNRLVKAINIAKGYTYDDGTQRQGWLPLGSTQRN